MYNLDLQVGRLYWYNDLVLKNRSVLVLFASWFIERNQLGVFPKVPDLF